jgi:hypothetical protein
MFFENRSQFLAALAQMPFHGTSADHQLLRDIFYRISLDIKQPAYYPGGRRQPVQQYIDILPFEGEQRIITAICFLGRLRQIGCVGSERYGHRSPEFVKSRIADNGVHPVKELSFFRMIGAYFLKDLQHPIIDRLYRLVIMLEKPSAQAKKRRIKLFIQFFLTRPVIPGATFYNLLQIFQILFWLKNDKIPGHAPGIKINIYITTLSVYLLGRDDHSRIIIPVKAIIRIGNRKRPFIGNAIHLHGKGISPVGIILHHDIHE